MYLVDSTLKSVSSTPPHARMHKGRGSSQGSQNSVLKTHHTTVVLCEHIMQHNLCFLTGSFCKMSRPLRPGPTNVEIIAPSNHFVVAIRTVHRIRAQDLNS